MAVDMKSVALTRYLYITLDFDIAAEKAWVPCLLFGHSGHIANKYSPWKISFTLPASPYEVPVHTHTRWHGHSGQKACFQCALFAYGCIFLTTLTRGSMKHKCVHLEPYILCRIANYKQCETMRREKEIFGSGTSVLLLTQQRCFWHSGNFPRCF